VSGRPDGADPAPDRVQVWGWVDRRDADRMDAYAKSHGGMSRSLLLRIVIPRGLDYLETWESGGPGNIPTQSQHHEPPKE
jgi:hypothetical protein